MAKIDVKEVRSKIRRSLARSSSAKNKEFWRGYITALNDYKSLSLTDFRLLSIEIIRF